MATVPDAQIAALARQYGLDPVVTFTALALAESSGNPAARNSCCTGLWQIHKIHAGTIPGSPRDVTAFRNWLEVPTNNAAAAKHILGSQGLRAWEAYTNGAYQRFMSRAAQAAGQNASLSESLGALASNPGAAVDVAAGGALEAITSVPDAIAAVAEAINDAVEVVIDAAAWLSDPGNWLRVAQVAGGIAVVVVGLAILGVGPAGKAVNAVPGGKLLT